MKKTTLLIISMILVLGLLFGSCAGNNVTESETPDPTQSDNPSKAPEKENTIANIVGLKGPTSMGMVRLFAEILSLSDYVGVEFDVVTSPEVITAGLLNGEIDIAAIPTNLAAIIFNKTEGDIIMLGVNTLGVIHIVADKSLEIDSIEDLRGKTIGATGKGSVPEYVLNYILEKNGLVPGTDVNIEYRTDHSELATLVELGEVDIAMLPQPFVTIVTQKNEQVELAIDLNNEWNKVAPEGSVLPMGCLVARTDFFETYTSEVMQLLVAYNDSVNWVNSYPEEAADLIVEYEILPTVEIAIAAIPESNIRYIFSQNSKDLLNNFFEILYEYEPKSIGGAIPGDEFYIN
ncbi:MAG: ABC transporter substrate-binding protein [Clostridia bacterium]|nr:ABC transporter substrate-binding protein [Clostridia bacterium]MBN2882785.1 ABC transporter substrate-binding protein [Clostridia bacterium]